MQVLRLLERFDMDIVQAAIKDALLRRAVSFDAICHLMLCRVERRPARLDMSIYPLLGFYSAVDSSKVFHSKPSLWINA